MHDCVHTPGANTLGIKIPVKKSLPLFVILISIWVPLTSFALELKTAAQNSAPKYYKSDSNQMAGLCVDIIHAIERVCPDMTFRGYHEFTPFKRLQHQLESGELDIFLGLKPTAKRKERLNFLNIPLYQLQYVIAVRIDDPIKVPDFDAIRTLYKNSKILTVHGSAASVFLRNRGGLRVDDRARSPSTLLKMLKYKRGRFAFYHDLGLYHVMHTEGFVDDIRILPGTFLNYAHYAAFSKTVPEETIHEFEIALKKLKNSGELTRIHTKYIVRK